MHWHSPREPATPVERRETTGRWSSSATSIRRTAEPVIQCNIRDITERRRMAEERERLFHEAEVARDRAEAHETQLADADRRKDEFLAMLAHELRNPLAAINGAVDLARSPDMESQRGWTDDLVKRQVKHLARLIDDLLDISRHLPGPPFAINEERRHDICMLLNLGGERAGEDARLRGEAGLRGIRIIAISGYDADMYPGRSRRAGFDHHLVKPVDIDDLLPLLSPTSQPGPGRWV